MKVIGTAGHIDHGKSSLVERLTGVDPDRLAEEKRRGMTIDLGFASLTLPSGTVVSMVDVPGHERFIRNMLAGAGGVDIGLIVVAADEGAMPQTREHIDILNLLSIDSAVVALTKVDLVDDDWLMLVEDDVRRLLAGSALADSEIFPVSSITSEGIDALLDGLDRAVQAVPPVPPGRTAYLPVDRVFTVAGFGTVATGTLHDGSFTTGMDLEILPAGRHTKIRGLQSHGQQLTVSAPGSRVAVNLAGATRDGLNRGDVLAPVGAIHPVLRFDASIRVLDAAPVPLRHGVEVMLHLGASESPARIAVLNDDCIEPGSTGWAQIRLHEPIAAVQGQPFIVRLPAPARTVAGGRVVDLAPHHRRFDPGASSRLEGMTSKDPATRVAAILSDNRPRDASQLAELAGLAAGSLQNELAPAVREGLVVRRGDVYLSRAGWEALASRADALIRQYHRDNQLRPGMPREELRRKLHIPTRDWTATMAILVQSGIVEEHGPLLKTPGWQLAIASRREEAERVLTTLRSQPFSPPDGASLLSTTSTDPSLLRALAEQGEIVRVADGLYFDRAAYDRMLAIVTDIITTTGDISVAQARDALGTTRKYALALLEHLDDQHITRRIGETRVFGSKRPACA